MASPPAPARAGADMTINDGPPAHVHVARPLAPHICMGGNAYPEVARPSLDLARPFGLVDSTGYAVLTGSMLALTPLAPVHFHSYAMSDDSLVLP